MFDLIYVAVPVAIFFGFLILFGAIKSYAQGMNDKEQDAMLIILIIETVALSVILL